MHAITKAIGVLFLATALPCAVEAQDTSEKMLVIRLKSGKVEAYPLSQVESIQFEDGKGESRVEGKTDTRGGSIRIIEGNPANRSDARQALEVRILRGPASGSMASGPQNVFDGNPATGWLSTTNARPPFEFVVEMPRSEPVGVIEFDNAAQEAAYPGAAARDVRVLASNVAPSGPYTTLAAMALARGVNAQRFTVGPVTARWLRVVVSSNYGHPNYTQLMDMRVYPPPEPAR